MRMATWRHLNRATSDRIVDSERRIDRQRQLIARDDHDIVLAERELAVLMQGHEQLKLVERGFCRVSTSIVKLTRTLLRRHLGCRTIELKTRPNRNLEPNHRDCIRFSRRDIPRQDGSQTHVGLRLV